jgi:hypothetical protein
MSGLFRSIINIFNPKKQIAQKQEEGSKIYLDRGKNTYLLIKLLSTDTCQDIHINYHNEILGELMKNNQNSGGSFSKIINSNEFSFFVIDDENPFLELKLKMKDSPSKFLKKKSINLFYLEVCQNKKEDYSVDKLVSDEGTINGTTMQRSQSVKNEESIREGELMKYSFRHKKFESRVVVLDKEKLIITKPKDKGKLIFLYLYLL